MEKMQLFRLCVKRLYIALFILFLAAVGVASVVLEKPTVSELEKRTLAEMPTFTTGAYLSGNYAKELSSHYSDTFPCRDQLVAFGNQVKENLGEAYEGIYLQPGETFGIVAPEVEMELPEITTVPAVPPVQLEDSSKGEEATLPPEESSESTLSEGLNPVDPSEATTSNGIFILNNRAYQLYYGGAQTAISYAQAIANLSTLLPDVQFYNLVVPSPIEFALPDKYRDVSAEEKPQLDTLYRYVRDYSDGAVQTVDAYSKISAHSEEYLYFGTDHHWTVNGAYYAYKAFCQQANTVPVDVSQLEKRTINNFLGSLYRLTQSSALASNPDKVEYYIMPGEQQVVSYDNGGNGGAYTTTLYAEYATGANSYSVFLGGDLPLTIIDTDVDNDRVIAVVKESYGNAFVPFLVNNYSRVVVVDPRYCTRNFGEIVSTFGVNEVLIINNIFAAHTPGNVNYIWRLGNEVTSFKDGSLSTTTEIPFVEDETPSVEEVEPENKTVKIPPESEPEQED